MCVYSLSEHMKFEENEKLRTQKPTEDSFCGQSEMVMEREQDVVEVLPCLGRKTNCSGCVSLLIHFLASQRPLEG